MTLSGPIPRSLMLTIGVALLCSCQATRPSFSRSPAPHNAGPRASGSRLSLQVHSGAFRAGSMIPREYTCEGKGISPPLAWSAPPAGTATLALICEDPDAPGGIWTHWVLFNLPAKTRSLPAAVPPPSSTAGGVQGINSFQKPGYGGPCPPNGTHRYYFRLYALNIRLHLPATTTREQLLDAIRGHIIAEGALMGRYRKG